MKLNWNREDISETSIFISRLATTLLLYLLLKAVFPNNSKLPVIIGTLLFVTIISNTPMFNSFKKKINKYAYEINDIKEFKLDRNRTELITSIVDMKHYLSNAQKWNNRRRSLFRQMSPLQQNIARPVNYPKKLNLIEEYFAKNNDLLTLIVSNSLKKYDIKDYELKLVEDKYLNSKTNNYFRVVESLCHYARDWSVAKNDEVEPLLSYIKDQCKDFDINKTIAIVPGSGLGGVSHSLAQLNFSSVHAVEFSWLMVLMNEFIYEKNTVDKINVYPYLHTYSNHISTNDQIRPVEIELSLKKPDNLTIHNSDFTKFDIHDHLKTNEEANNLIFVTCFFIDTAENLIEYFQSINEISAQFKGKKKWINLGPLKYGTAAKIELSYEEIKMIIESMGWEFVDEQDPKLLGYLTDKKGLWQGYYNVMMWSALKK